MKIVLLTLALSVGLASAATAYPRNDHHRHRVCTWRHHHRVCRWR
jgi:hypothetical protein